MDQARPLRADAARNRARVLAAAEEVFAAEGLAVPLDEIACRAGVGPGTVYRHFPTKDALFEAVVADRLERLTERARQLLDAPDPGEAFLELFGLLVGHAVGNRGLADALAFPEGMLQAVWERKQALARELSALLERAQQAGAIRPDIGGADLQALVVGCLAMSRQPGEGAWLDIVRDGLRARN